MLDAIGLTHLVKRGGELGGSAPLRAVQGCAPLLDGNAFGFQVTSRLPITLRRRAGRLDVEIAAPFAEAFRLTHRAVLQRIVAQGLLRPDDPFLAEFADDIIVTDGENASGARLWTGLLVRADPGVFLRVSDAGNRRNRQIGVEERFIADDGAFAPLVLNIRPRSGAPDRIILDGELATLAPFAPGARIDDASLAQAPEVGAAHAAFYDRAYFDAKSRGITRKYRKARLPSDPSPGDPPARTRVIAVGPSQHVVSGAVRRIAFMNQVPFEASFDGYTLAVDADRRALDAGARAVEETFAAALGAGFLRDNPRAIRYFTGHSETHQAGEPHFFIKPWSFVQTAPGWSCLLEGVAGDGFDVMRGIVATDMFHATPAVFHMLRMGEPIRMGREEPLLYATPIPRWLLRSGFRTLTLRV